MNTNVVKRICFMLQDYLPAIFAFFLTSALVPVIKRISLRFSIVDHPGGEAKKLHKKPVPLMGGLAIYLAIALVLLYALSGDTVLLSGIVGVKEYLGYLLGGAVLMIGGALDDKFVLPPRLSFMFPLVAAGVAVAFNIGVSKVSNPFGFDPIEISAAASQIITFLWLLVVMYVTKFLDGLDGLATGVSAIGALMMTGLALTAAYFQPDAAVFASICAGAMLGFLLWNRHPAKIFLGEGGSTFVGYTIGVLAVIGGAKVGTALLVLSIPLLDVIWVILRRVLVEHRSPTVGDRKHLHHRLLDLGFTHGQVVLLYFFVATIFGVGGLFLQSAQKLALFGLIVLAMLISASVLVFMERRRL